MDDALRNSAAHVFVEDLDALQISDDDFHHMVKVLRLREGETVSFADGNGSWRTATIAEVGKSSIEFSSLSEITADTTDPRFGVAFPLLKGDRTELMLQKLTEVGVSDLYVLDVDRAVVPARDTFEKKQQRWAAIVREAAMQSRRTRLPQLHEPVSLAELVELLPGAVGRAEPGGGAIKPDLSVIAVGPEGGWSEDELSLGVPGVGLGPTILRAETAAIVAGTRLAEQSFGQ